MCCVISAACVLHCGYIFCSQLTSIVSCLTCLAAHNMEQASYVVHQGRFCPHWQPYGLQRCSINPRPVAAHFMQVWYHHCPVCLWCNEQTLFYQLGVISRSQELLSVHACLDSMFGSCSAIYKGLGTDQTARTCTTCNHHHG